MTFKTLCVFGTRPEAIKMAPVIKRLQATPTIENKVCVTGQHRQMLDSVLEQFEIVPDYNLEVMTEWQSLSNLTTRILSRIDEIYTQYKPNLVLVHGDTTTTLAATLSAYYHHIPVAHVEAGLRTGNINAPWPEEANRRLTGVLAKIHFAPTALARRNLLAEGIDDKTIYVTGNTVIDALYAMVNKLATEPALNQKFKQQFHFLKTERKMILVTGHRRESFGEGFERICQALANIALLYPEVDIVYPVHLNPNVQQPVKSLLGEIKNIHLIEPVDYLPFIYLMESAHLILTDSGGIQEEASSLGKPVLVMRDTSDRPEAIDAGVVKLVGTNVTEIVKQIKALLEPANNHSSPNLQSNPTFRDLFAESIDLADKQQDINTKNLYGDGKAAERIVNIISQLANKTSTSQTKHKEEALV